MRLMGEIIGCIFWLIVFALLCIVWFVTYSWHRLSFRYYMWGRGAK